MRVVQVVVEVEEVIQPSRVAPLSSFKQVQVAVADWVKITMAEPVELVEEIVEILEEPELMVQLVEGAERNQRVAQAELAQAPVPEVTVLLVLQTQVELVTVLMQVMEVPVSGVEVVEVETTTAELAEVVVQVSELSEHPAQARLRGTASMVTVALPETEVLPKPLETPAALLSLRDVPVGAVARGLRLLQPKTLR